MQAWKRVGLGFLGLVAIVGVTNKAAQIRQAGAAVPALSATEQASRCRTDLQTRLAEYGGQIVSDGGQPAAAHAYNGSALWAVTGRHGEVLSFYCGVDGDGALVKQQARPLSAEEQGRREEDIAHAEVAVRRGLKDPESAVFDQPYWSWVTGAVCGHVNAKNSFGAMAGASAYIATSGREIKFQGEPGFGSAWLDSCTDPMPSGTKTLTTAQRAMIQKGLTPEARRQLPSAEIAEQP